MGLASDIRAGGAYVELGAKDSGLEAALKAEDFSAAMTVLAAALLAVALSFRGFVDMFEADVPASQSHRGGTLAAAFF